MNVKQLIEALMALDDLEMPIGTTNYYGNFGYAVGVTIEVSEGGTYSDSPANETEGKKVVVINFALDMQ